MPTHDEKHWEDVKNHLGGRKPRDMDHLREISDLVRIKQGSKPYADSTLKRIAEQQGLFEKGTREETIHEQHWNDAVSILGKEPETFEQLRYALNQRDEKLPPETILGIAEQKKLVEEGTVWEYKMKQYGNEVFTILGKEPGTVNELRDALDQRKEKLSEEMILAVAKKLGLIKDKRGWNLEKYWNEAVGFLGQKPETIDELRDALKKTGRNLSEGSILNIAKEYGLAGKRATLEYSQKKYWDEAVSILGKEPKTYEDLENALNQRKKKLSPGTILNIAEQYKLVEKGRMWEYNREKYWNEAVSILGKEPKKYEELKLALNQREEKLSERTILGVAEQYGLVKKGAGWEYNIKKYWEEASDILGRKPKTLEELRDALKKTERKLSEGTILSVATMHGFENCRKEIIKILTNEIGQKETKQDVINELDASGLDKSIVNQITEKCLRDVNASKLVQRMKGRALTPEMLNKLKGVLKRMGLEDKKTNALIEKHLGK